MARTFLAAGTQIMIIFLIKFKHIRGAGSGGGVRVCGSSSSSKAPTNHIQSSHKPQSKLPQTAVKAPEGALHHIQSSRNAKTAESLTGGSSLAGRIISDHTQSSRQGIRTTPKAPT